MTAEMFDLTFPFSFSLLLVQSFKGSLYQLLTATELLVWQCNTGCVQIAAASELPAGLRGTGKRLIAMPQVANITSPVFIILSYYAMLFILYASLKSGCQTIAVLHRFQICC